MRIGPRELVNHASFRIDKGMCIGLVGRNGAGKTTTMRLLAGEADRGGAAEYTGTISSSGTVGYLAQDTHVGDPSMKARDRIISVRGIDSIIARIRKAEHEMSTTEGARQQRAMERYVKLDQQFTNSGGWAANAEAAQIAHSLGLEDRVLDQTLDMSMNMVLPQSMVGKASEVFGQLTSKLGVNVPAPSTIPVAITATGSIKSPKVKIELAQGLQEQVKEAVKEKVQEVVQRVKEDVGKRKEELLAKAQAQADKLVAEAKKLADKTREEAQAKADQLLAEAKKNGMLAELAAKAGAAKLVEEGNSVADKIEREARAKADEVMAKAREEADKLQ